VDAAQFRDTLRMFPSGVTVVTIRSRGLVHGLTVSAFVSVSPHPPLIAIVIDRGHTAHPLMEHESAVFAVNVLREDQARLSDRFAWVEDEDRFLQGDWAVAVTGAPVLRSALAWLDCRVWLRQPAGTHSIYVGEVWATATAGDGAPLIHWNRQYGTVARDPRMRGGRGSLPRV
jgi:flavin reductase (DIM6/NTAB) family NADH-FMN oxidoreductase RutF